MNKLESTMRDPEPEDMEGRCHAAIGCTVHQQRVALRHPRTMSTMAWEQKQLSARECRARGRDTAGWAKRGCGVNCLGMYGHISVNLDGISIKAHEEAAKVNHSQQHVFSISSRRYLSAGGAREILCILLLANLVYYEMATGERTRKQVASHSSFTHL